MGALGFGDSDGGVAYLFTVADAPVDGVAGTKAGVAAPGSLLVDTTNLKLYINTNTEASPTWTVVGSQS